jgi:uncharacterized repeat protein (TIGR01451 family)
MISVQQRVRWKYRFKPKSTALILAALAGLISLNSAHATGTTAGTTINNRATVNYSVGGTSQTPIESSPTGNSTAGVGNGASTAFLVDRRVLFTVAEASGNATNVSPGQNDRVTWFTVTNSSNAAEGFALSASNLAATVLFTHTDNFDMTSLRVFVDNPGGGGTAGVYDPAIDTATNINSLAADASVTVFIVANTPLATANGAYANVRLRAQAAVAGTNGATLEVATNAPDNPAAVDVLFGDTGNDGIETGDDQYAVQSAALTIQKTSQIISDPFNGAGANRLTVPGSVMEYVLTITNNGAVPATSVQVQDTLDGNLNFDSAQYNGGLSDVQIVVGGGAPTFCVAESGADTNGDGCSRAGQTLTVNPTAGITVASGGAAQAAVIRFRVTIK